LIRRNGYQGEFSVEGAPAEVKFPVGRLGIGGIKKGRKPAAASLYPFPGGLRGNIKIDHRYPRSLEQIHRGGIIDNPPAGGNNPASPLGGREARPAGLEVRRKGAGQGRRFGLPEAIRPLPVKFPGAASGLFFQKIVQVNKDAASQRRQGAAGAGFSRMLRSNQHDKILRHASLFMHNLYCPKRGPMDYTLQKPLLLYK
jgi:hypothetical protein